jgi:hypothetical protein
VVSGISAHFEGPGAAQDVSGGTGNVPGLKEGDTYSLTLKGTSKAQGKIVDSDGKGVAKVKIKIERTYGESVDLETDASGKYEVPDFVGEEPYSVQIISVPAKASGILCDENGKPMSGARARITTDGGKVFEVVSDGKGKYELEGVFPGEGYTIEVEPEE